MLLSAKLINPDLCPSCLVERHIKEVHECQTGIKNRGGIFGSKQKALDEREAGDGKTDSQAKRHRAWSRKWRVVKIQACRDIDMLESILEELDEEDEGDLEEMATVRARIMTQAALSQWNTEAENLTKMPGMHEETWPENIPLPEGDDIDLAPQDIAISPSEITPSLDTTLTEMEDAVTRMLQRMDIEEEAHLRQSIYHLNLQAFPRPPRLVMPIRPILRPWPVITPRPSTQRSSKSIRFSDVATIAANPSSPTLLHQPHNAHTSADMKRQSKQFHRVHPNYKPSTWSSLEGLEKIETSWFNLDEETAPEELEGKGGDEERGDESVELKVEATKKGIQEEVQESEEEGRYSGVRF